VARALDAAHASGIAHRDLKPENIFLLLEDDVPFPKLLDFGIAKLLGESGVGHKTRTGTPMGTPYYMSPEQCRGRNVDHRTDIYSFGIVLFETLVGKVPFEGEDVMEILFKNTSAAPPRPSDVCRTLPAALDAPVLAFLEKDPDKRPESVGAGLDAVAAAAAGAGLDVKVSARRTGRDGGHPHTPGGAEPTTTVHVGGGATPADADARTMLPEATKTVLAGEALPKPAGSRTTVYAGAGAAVVIAAFGLAMTRGPHGPASETTNALVATTTAAPGVTAAATATAVAPVTSAPAHSEVTPSATVEAAPAEIEVTFDATPKEVDVYQGTVKLGSSTGPVKLKRAEGKVKLTLKAPGYAPQEVEVPSSASATVPVTLKKLVGPKKPYEF
jgi:serine/threonine-protein kinase